MHIGKKQTVDLFNKGAFKLDTLEFRIHSSYRYKRYHYFFSDIHSNDILQWRV